jgi:hypothetical protein
MSKLSIGLVLLDFLGGPGLAAGQKTLESPNIRTLK